MDLKEAILRAARFAAKPKAEGPAEHKFIRFLPGLNPTDKAHVFATNGLFGIVLTLDSDVEVQNACAPADLCVQMARESDFIARMDWEGKGLSFTARRKKGTDTYRYKIPAGNIATFPAFQTAPEPMPYIPEWEAVAAVVHAASGQNESNTALRCVRFTETTVEALDRLRLARADVRADWQGLVPCELFDHWPKGDVFARFTAIHAFFRIGSDEVRYSPLQHGKFPDTRTFLADEHNGGVALCPVDKLMAAVKQAAKMTKSGSIYLEFRDDTVKVSSWTHRPDQKFTTVVPALGAAPGTVLLGGANLAEALNALTTPRVLVGYGTEDTDLLRLDSGRVTVGIYPRREPKAEAPPP